MHWLAVVSVLVLAFVIYYRSVHEMFMPMPMMSGSKRNMSHDIRGDPYIPYVPVSPFNQPEVLPLRNREMYME